jgi:hypothetical protein
MLDTRGKLSASTGYCGPSASAQAHQSAARVPVLLAVVDSLPDTGPRFRIVRQAGASVRQVVLLPPDANPELLAEAVETLRMLWTRGEDGGTADAGAIFRRVPTTTQPPAARRVPSWAGRVLHDLREARPRQVPGIGHVRTVQIWLAPLPAGAARTQP